MNARGEWQTHLRRPMEEQKALETNDPGLRERLKANFEREMSRGFVGGGTAYSASHMGNLEAVRVATDEQKTALAAALSQATPPPAPEPAPLPTNFKEMVQHVSQLSFADRMRFHRENGDLVARLRAEHEAALRNGRVPLPLSKSLTSAK